MDAKKLKQIAERLIKELLFGAVLGGAVSVQAADLDALIAAARREMKLEALLRHAKAIIDMLTGGMDYDGSPAGQVMQRIAAVLEAERPEASLADPDEDKRLKEREAQ